MTSAREKGDDLEIAVHTIERLILATSPALKEKSFNTERRKVMVVRGVHHEIDVFVSVDLAKATQPNLYLSARIGKPLSERMRSLCFPRRSMP
jgi:hypothetical protein